MQDEFTNDQVNERSKQVLRDGLRILARIVAKQAMKIQQEQNDNIDLAALPASADDVDTSKDDIIC